MHDGAAQCGMVRCDAAGRAGAGGKVNLRIMHNTADKELSRAVSRQGRTKGVEAASASVAR